MNLRVSIVLRVLFLVCCVAVTGFAQNVKVTESARQHFQAGVAYLEEPTGAKYEEAYREFHAAYAESPSYKILNNIALCALYLERDGEAIDAYERYLAAAPKNEIPADKRAQIDSDLKRLKAGLVRLKLKVSPASATLIDERLAVQGNNLVNRYSVSNGELTLGIHPGTHRFTVNADGYAAQTWEVDAGPGSKQEREVTLVAVGGAAATAVQDASASRSAEPATTSNRDVTAPAQTKKEKSYTAAYVSAAVTGVFVASATVTGLLALSKKGKLEDLNEAQEDHAAAVDARKDAKRFALFCDISLGAAVLAAGATTYFYFTAPTKERPVAASRAVRFAPAIAPGFAGLAAQGSF
jgi:phage gp36-like protein